MLLCLIEEIGVEERKLAEKGYLEPASVLDSGVAVPVVDLRACIFGRLMTMDVVLIVEQGKTRTKKIRLHQQETLIGRRRDCALCIPSAEVSRRHCTLRYQDGYLTVEDLDSVNGTFLNGARIAGREVVYPGDRLAVGSMKFVVQYQLSQSVRAMLQAAAPVEKVFDFGGASQHDEEPPTVKVESGGDGKFVHRSGEAASDFEVVEEIGEADWVEEIEDAELVDVGENAEPGLAKISDEPEGVEIINDPEAVEIIEDPQGVEVIDEPDVVEIIDNPEVIEGSKVLRAGEKEKKDDPVGKKSQS